MNRYATVERFRHSAKNASHDSSCPLVLTAELPTVFAAAHVATVQSTVMEIQSRISLFLAFVD